MTIEVIPSVTGVKYSNGDGYYFRLSQKLNHKLYLNCQVKSCRVRGNLPVNYISSDKIKVRGIHNHPPDFYEYEFCQVERRILERAAKEPTSLRKIFMEETANVSPKTVRRLNYPSFLRRMQRRRQFTVQVAPRSLNEFAKHMLSSEYTDYAYLNGKKFFFGAIKNHSIIYISPTTRELLKWDDQNFIIYQTRKVISQNLKNVMIISQIVANVALPVVYIVMKLRTKKAYVDVLSRIVEEEPLWKPCKLYACQEESLVSAINDSIPGCEIISSWFHLTQELKKTIKNLDLMHLLHSDIDFFNCVELLQGIPLLPADFMSTGYEIVKQKIMNLLSQPGVFQLMQYINENWLSGSQPTTISIFNKLEGLKIEMKLLHRQFMSSFRGNSRKDALWSFTKGLVVLEKKYADAYKELISTDSPPKWTGNCSCRTQEKKIYNAMHSFSNGKLSIEAFLENIAKISINIMDLNDENIQEVSDDDNSDSSIDCIKIEFVESSESSDNELANFDDYIVEEVQEEYSENEELCLAIASTSNCIKTSETKQEYFNHEDNISNITISSLNKTNEDENLEIRLENSENEINSEDGYTKFLCNNEENFIEKQILVFDSLQSKLDTKCNDGMCHACVICKTNMYSFACQPCGHLCLCDNCYTDIIQKDCPMCSKKVLWIQKIILAHH